MKMLSRSRRLVAVLALSLPAALVAPGAAVATPDPPEFQTPVDPKTGTEITFTVDAPSPDLTYTWDTDGNPDTWQADTPISANVTYATAGDKAVTLRATANDGTYSDTTKNFTVTDPVLPPPPPANNPPTASFSVSNSRPIVGDTVTLTSTSSDPDGQPIVRQTWSANGGSYSFSAPGATSTTVTFAEAGDWKVTLEVSDGQLTSKRTKTIHVSKAPPPPNQLPNIPSFTFSPDRPSANEVVQFTASASDPDGTIESIEWDFDNDGVVDASGGSVQRVFKQGGTATVVLIVTDDRGGERRAFQAITIAGAGSLSGEATSQGNVTGAPTGANVNPGSTPNNSGTSSVRLLNPIIRLRGAIVSGRTRISLLQVYGVPRGAKVRARCRGGGCPKGLVVSTAQTNGRSIRLRAFERRLSPGATIEVFVTQSGRLGKYTRWRIMRTKAPIRTDKCIRSYGRKPSSCPQGD